IKPMSTRRFMGAPQIENFITNSQLHIWRVLIALAHADGLVQEKEKNWLSHCLLRLNLTDEQKQILRSDFQNPQDYKFMFKQISELRDYVHLQHMANILINLDGVVTEKEKEIMTFLQTAYRGPSSDANRTLAADVERDVRRSYRSASWGRYNSWG